MKKILSVTVLVLFVLVFASPVLAQEPDDDTGSLPAESPANPLAFLDAWFTDMPRCDGWGNFVSTGQTAFIINETWSLAETAYGYEFDGEIKIVFNHGQCWTEIVANRLQAPLVVVFSADGGRLHNGLGDTDFTWDQVLLINTGTTNVVIDTDGAPENDLVTAYLTNYGYSMGNALIKFALGDLPAICVLTEDETHQVDGICNFWLNNHNQPS